MNLLARLWKSLRPVRPLPAPDAPIMEWERLLAAARELPAETRLEYLRQLACDPRWVALVSLLDQRQRDAEAVVIKPIVADRHGTLAHAAGALFEIRELLTVLERVSSQKNEKVR